MPRCFFNIRDRNEYHRDTTGHVCDTIEHMEREAALTAAALTGDNAAKGLTEQFASRFSMRRAD